MAEEPRSLNCNLDGPDQMIIRYSDGFRMFFLPVFADIRALRLSLPFAIAASVFTMSSAPAMDPDSRALWGASALAVADFYRGTPCKWWTVDEAAVERVVAWSGRSLAQLRASEDCEVAAPGHGAK